MYHAAARHVPDSMYQGRGHDGIFFCQMSKYIASIDLLNIGMCDISVLNPPNRLFTFFVIGAFNLKSWNPHECLVGQVTKPFEGVICFTGWLRRRPR